MHLSTSSSRSRWLRLGWITVAWLTLFAVVDYGLGRFLEAGLIRYFGLHTPAVVLCVGHSRSGLAIDEGLLAERLGVPVAKYTMDGVRTVDREAMIRFALARQPGIRLVVYDVESTTFTREGLSENSYRLFLPFMDDPAVRGMVRSQCPDRWRYVLHRVVRSTRYDEGSVNRALRGWLNRRGNLKMGQVPPALIEQQVSGSKARAVRIEPSSRVAFERTVDSVLAHDRRMLLWQPPTLAALEQVQPAARKAVRDIFRDLAAQREGVAFVEYTDCLNHRDDLFYDAIHVNAQGKQAVSERLAEDIARLLGDHGS